MSRRLKIPRFLKEKLESSSINKLVEEILADYIPWISRNQTVFFHEYTDHGVEHIESILETSVLLLTNQSKSIFTDHDAALLIISTILHDVALHLQRDQFVKLVSKGSYLELNEKLDSDNWHSLWVKFSAEASRFNKLQLITLFGIEDPIEIPLLNTPDKWNYHQLQLIGEFLRRNHPRLAHDFALYGFPVNNNEREYFLKSGSQEFNKFIDLSGLVSRSHGTSLRQLMPYLSERFGHLRNQEGSHAIFVMALLRIADFLQLQSDRAPKGQLIIKSLRSPLSRREWNVHSAILNIIYDEHDDPESVEIIIDHSKLDIETFLRIQSLLFSLQLELDHSWAVLGEIYGRFELKKDLGLRIRRVRSNIDDLNTFGKVAGFVPKKATFTAADAELLKLFIKPLYGDFPQIAVRELVQNSVDAVRERLIFDSDNEQLNLKPSVIVSIIKEDKGVWVLRIEDKGIGMTLDTITNYFLNAGASFRLSKVWKEQFIDNSGKVKVLRSGRFGVGALAAFMISDDPTNIKMKVSTRHISSKNKDGYEFTTSLSSKPIQISYIKKKEVGTTIEIVTKSPPAFMMESNKKENQSSWDWYCLDKPIVQRIGHNNKRIPQNVNLPANIMSSKSHYHWIGTKDYASIGWTYEDFPSIVCNGIIVMQENQTKYQIAEGEFLNSKLKIRLPNLSIFDRDGKLPITLDRLRIDFDNLQFIPTLLKDIELNILAFLLVSAPLKNILKEKNPKSIQNLTHPSFAQDLSSIPWIYTAEGTFLFSPELFHINNVNTIYEVEEGSTIKILKSIMDIDNYVGIYLGATSIWKTIDELNAIIKSGSRVYIERSEVTSREERRILELLSSPRAKSKRIEISEREIHYFFESKFGKISHFNNDDIFRLIRNTLEEKVYKEFDSSRDLFSLFERIHDGIRDEILDKTELIAILFRVSTERINSLRKIESIVYNELNKNLSKRHRIFERRDRIRRHRPHFIEEIFYKIESTEMFSRDFRNELRYRLDKEIDGEFSYQDIDEINYEFEQLLKKEPKLRIDTKKRQKSKIDWESIFDKNYIRNHSAGRILSEFVLKKNSKFSNQNNILTRIWLEYIGNRSIPYTKTKRRKFLSEFKKKYPIERHLQHWYEVLE